MKHQNDSGKAVEPKTSETTPTSAEQQSDSEKSSELKTSQRTSSSIEERDDSEESNQVENSPTASTSKTTDIEKEGQHPGVIDSGELYSFYQDTQFSSCSYLYFLLLFFLFFKGKKHVTTFQPDRILDRGI